MKVLSGTWWPILAIWHLIYFVFQLLFSRLKKTPKSWIQYLCWLRFDTDPISTLTNMNQRADFPGQLISGRDAYFQRSFITAVVSGHAEEIRICSRQLLLDTSMQTQLWGSKSLMFRHIFVWERLFQLLFY